jgi:hypothetical protein
MLSRRPELYCSIRIDGFDLSIYAHLITSIKRKMHCVRYRIDWTTYKGYKQHAIVDVDLHKIGQVCISRGTLQSFVQSLILERYQSRVKLGHGISDINPYVPSP